MPITKVTVTIGRTVNIGNYESIRADITLEETLIEQHPDSAAITEVRKKLNIQACKELDATINNMVKAYRS